MLFLMMFIMPPWVDMECRERCHEEDNSTVCESNWNDCKEKF